MWWRVRLGEKVWIIGFEIAVDLLTLIFTTMTVILSLLSVLIRTIYRANIRSAFTIIAK